MNRRIESNNVFVILAGIALMVVYAALVGVLRLAVGIVRPLVIHWRLFALMALPVVAFVLVIYAAPLLFAMAGNVLVAVGGLGALRVVILGV